MNYVLYTNCSALRIDFLCSVASKATDSPCFVIKRPSDLQNPVLQEPITNVVLHQNAVNRSMLYTLRQNGLFIFFEDKNSKNTSENYEGRNFYDIRILVNGNESEEELATTLQNRLSLKPFFSSTRAVDNDLQSTTASVLVQGIAADGGLFVPRTLPSLSMAEIQALVERTERYEDVAQFVLELFFSRERSVGSVLSPQNLHNEIIQAYSRQRWSADEGGDICPLRPSGSDRMALLELFHGPTAAFKDFALQLFPRLFTLCWQYQERYQTSQCLVLAATSGDTGIAAIQGFINAKGAHNKVLVLYPQKGVSEVQRQQMLKADDGATSRVLAVDSDFDFCQSAVKTLFNSQTTQRKLKASYNVELSSANSINWGRLAPQIVYYFHAYSVAVKKGLITVGEAVQFIVPTGNFGNILCGYLAKRMGLPIASLVLASNENDVLAEFITTGVYDIRQRSLSVTASPSIDILRASNIERFLYYMTNGDTQEVRRCMQELETNKIFTVSNAVRTEMKSFMFAGKCTERKCKATIREYYNATKIVIDTHTAVAVHVANKFRSAQSPYQIVTATAHFAKFPHAVYEALSDSSEPVPQDMALRDIYGKIRSVAPQSTIPGKFLETVDVEGKERRCPAALEAIETKLYEFLTPISKL